MTTRLLPWLAVPAALVAGLVLQTQLYAGQERTASTVLMFVGLAVAWNLIGGDARHACLGQGGFFCPGGGAPPPPLVPLPLWVLLAPPLAAPPPPRVSGRRRAPPPRVEW